MLQEIPCEADFTYVLSEEVNIQPTEYKVMQDQNVNCLVRCMRMKYNCRDALFYSVGFMKPFINEFRSADSDRATELIIALLKSVVDLKNVGFLSCVNIECSLQKVFWDGHANRVRLVYLPINQHFYPDEAAFESALRGALVRQIDDLSETGKRLTEVRNDLVNMAISLEEVVCNALGDEDVTLDRVIVKDDKAKLMLSATDPRPGSTQAFLLSVDRDEYVIGRSPLAEGVVPFSVYIGSKHCKILRNGDNFLVVDLDSKNGTYLNGAQLAPQQPYELHNGDCLTLANTDFQATILKGGAQ
jgi:FOG: FHA domain